MPSRTATFDSNGPEGRIRGNAAQVYEKYLGLARDAASSGDRVLAESFQQYAEHYYRVMNDSTDPQPLRPQMPEQREPGEAEEQQRGEWNSEPRGEVSLTRPERPRYEAGRGGFTEASHRNGQDAPFSRDRRAEGLSFESGDPRDQPNPGPTQTRGDPSQQREPRPPREERPRFERRREEGRPRGGNGGAEEPEDAGLRKMLGERPSRVREPGQEEEGAGEARSRETPPSEPEAREEPVQSGPATAEGAEEGAPRVRRRRRRLEESGSTEEAGKPEGGNSEEPGGSEEI